MRIFQIIFLPDVYQSLCQKDENLNALRICPKGTSRQEIWPARLELEVTEPSWPRGIFLEWSADEFVLTKEAQADKVLVQMLEVDGEFLPVMVDGEPMSLHNVTRFANCVDQKRSKWGATIGNVPGRIEYPRFLAEKVPLGIQFRIPEFRVPRYVATDPSLPPEKDFYQWYHQQGYKGLKFRLLWDSEKPDELIRFY
jgi:hypothetical protein